MVIPSKQTTPYVNLDSKNCVFSIKGKSYPEDPSSFYGPIILEIDRCEEDLKNYKITIQIALEILNSISTKYLFMLLKKLHELSSEVDIYWYYEGDDEGMFEEGCDIKSTFPNSNFKLIGVEDLRKI